MKALEHWFSDRARVHLTLARWGHYGTPVLLFPTAGGDAEEMERFLMIDALGDLIGQGRIKVYSIDSVAARIWHDTSIDPAYKGWLLNRFGEAIRHEVVPAIVADCGGAPDLPLVAAGASIGAFNAMACLCRYPDVFHRAICMSGSYDIERFIKGLHGPSQDVYFASPLQFVPNLPDGPQLALLRTRFALMCHGGGRWEDPDQDWRMAHVLGAQRIPNRVDPWGEGFDHDWPTWRRMLPHYLAEL